MTPAEILATLAFLDPETSVTVSVKMSDLRAALEARAGGPALLTAEQAALHLGRTAEFWRRAAAAGKVDRAWQDEKGGPWRLPRDACEAHLRSLQQRGRRRTTAVKPTARAVLPFDGGKARGPRKAS